MTLSPKPTHTVRPKSLNSTIDAQMLSRTLLKVGGLKFLIFAREISNIKLYLSFKIGYRIVGVNIR